MLDVRGLIKRFAAIQVLHGVNLQLRAGEVVGYLGPNGSGKSVTTRILTGLIEPSAGTVSVVASHREDAALASMVFEELPEDATQRLGLSARMVG